MSLMNAYSKDLRLKALAAIDRGIPREDVQDLFGLSRSTIKRWLNRRSLTGDLDVHKIPGRPSVKGEELRRWLPAHLERNPDLTLKEHCEAFADETGVAVSEATMSRQIARLPGGWPLKKVAHSPRARRGGEGFVAMAGFSLRPQAAGVLKDESGTHISMDRLRSRAPRGERACGRVPKNRGKNMTLIASMSLSGMGESMCIEGATDAKAFEAYVEHFLAPSLCEGQVVVMDRASGHTGQGG
jgi:transposase